MLTDVQLINLGLSEVAESRIKRIDPPGTPLEKYMAVRYDQWKRSELTKRRWVFALVEAYTLTATSSTESGSRPYKYPLPIDCLRPVRDKTTEWIQRGRDLYSAQDTLTIPYIRNAPESEFDPLFNDVLVARIARDSAEYVTQSNTKKEYAAARYKDAVREAGKANAFVIGPEDMNEESNEPSWLEARYHG